MPPRPLLPTLVPASPLQVLNLPWLRTTAPDVTIKSDILHSLRTFANQSRMRRLLLGLMAANLTGNEANRLLSQFYLVDADSSGTIELPELVQAAQKVGRRRGDGPSRHSRGAGA